MSDGVRLADAVRGLLADTASVYRDDPPVLAMLRAQRDRFDEPLRLAVAGPAGTGKSTLVNTLLGEKLAPARTATGTVPFAWYSDGPALRVTAFFDHAPPREVPASRAVGGLRLDAPAGMDGVAVEYPSRGLREFSVMDTPPLSPGVARRLAIDADAVVQLARHVSADEPVEPVFGPVTALGRQTAVGSILVLCRADEMSEGRVDALITAKQIARRARRRQGEVTGFQTVVAVAGLLAYAGRALRDGDFAALRALASVPRETLERFLLSVDEFTADTFPVPLDALARRALLARFGLLGVRLGITLVRTGCDTVTKLAAQLVQRSGLSELRDSIGLFFTGRVVTLKARSALLALEALLRDEPRPRSARLAARLDQLAAGAHEFRELRLIADLHCGRTTFGDETDAEALRLLGAHGTDLLDRLDAPRDIGEGDAFTAAVGAVDRWRRLAEGPHPGPVDRAAARVVVRSCEGLLAAFD